jgi:isocitrate dehydrogenase kinase/phosphatase
MENSQDPNLQEDSEEPEQDSNELQESLLKNTALTLSYEGLSKDLHYLIDKKVYLVTNTMKNLSNIFVALNSTSKRNTDNYLPGSKKDIKEFFGNIVNEFKSTNTFLDNLINQEIGDREDLIEEEVPNPK